MREEPTDACQALDLRRLHPLWVPGRSKHDTRVLEASLDVD